MAQPTSLVLNAPSVARPCGAPATHAVLDQLRAGEVRRLARDGYEPVLKKARWCVPKRRANLTGRQQFRLRGLLRYIQRWK
jgi:hypothetical protein